MNTNKCLLYRATTTFSTLYGILKIITDVTHTGLLFTIYLEWLIKAAANRGSTCSLMQAIDGRIALLSTSVTHVRSAIASIVHCAHSLLYFRSGQVKINIDSFPRNQRRHGFKKLGGAIFRQKRP